MLQSLVQAGPVWQALVGTVFTWGLTAAGAALVFILHGTQVKQINTLNHIDQSINRERSLIQV